jgi:hypothetical protein
MALITDQKHSRVLRFSNRKILATVFVLLGIQLELLFAVLHQWRDLFTALAFATGWLFCPLCSYIAVRRISETGFSWLWLLSVLVGFSSTALCAYSFYYLVNHAG